MSKFVWQPALFQSEDHGYGRGTGHVILPNGTALAVHHEQDDLANVYIREVFSLYLCEAEQRRAG